MRPFPILVGLSLAPVVMGGEISAGGDGRPDCHDQRCCETWCGYLFLGPPSYTSCVGRCIGSYGAAAKSCNTVDGPQPTATW